MVFLWEAIREWRKPEECHDCILIGPVYNDRPSSPLNRRVVHLRRAIKKIEVGDVAAVMGGRGYVRDVQKLGRITVPLLGNLELVPDWIRQILADEKGEVSQEQLLESMVDGITRRIKTVETCPEDEELITLDIFRARVLNRMKDKVFVFKEPSSFL